ncbi:hypothetical protein R1sor_012692 [Riccia sorocarpa]|uniref:Uncharacterized protein n=1 Tax=Riccia sorocarpa TaxID=122646 RepID=A0ABD3I563_9MARC
MGKETGVATGRQQQGGGAEKEDDVAADWKVGAREERPGTAGGLRPPKPNENAEEELEDEKEREPGEMHQLPRSSLAAASIPPSAGPKASLLFHSPQNNNNHLFLHHHDHLQQQAGSSLKDQNLLRTSSSSPLSKASVRTATAVSASFKPRTTVGQQKMPPSGGTTVRPPAQFAVSSSSTAAGGLPTQLARPVPARGSHHHGIIQAAAEGHEAVLHFQGPGRPISATGSRTGVKGLAQQQNSSINHSRAVHRPIVARSASPGVALQRCSTDDISQDGQAVLPMAGQASAPSIPTARIHSIVSSQHPLVAASIVSSQAVAASPQRSQTHASLQRQQVKLFNVSSAVRPLVPGSNLGSITDVPLRERSSDNTVLVKICDRKVRLSSEQDSTSLYALCRRWVRNDVPRTDQQAQLWEQPPLPRPLTPAEAEIAESEGAENGNKEDSGPRLEPDLTKPVETISEKELMQHHVEHFKNVRKRCREDRSRRVARFKQRLALLIPANPENGRRESFSDPSHHP